VGKKLKTSNNSKLASGEDIEDGAMIHIMANENMQEWGHSIIVIDETVKVAKKFLENDKMFLAGKKMSVKNKGYQNGQASGKDLKRPKNNKYLQKKG